MDFQVAPQSPNIVPPSSAPAKKELRGNITRFSLAGHSFEVGEMSLLTMRKCWSSIATLIGDASSGGKVVENRDIIEDQLKRSRAACEIIVCAMGGNHLSGEVDALENTVGFTHMNDVIASALELLRACGFLRPLPLTEVMQEPMSVPEAVPNP
jgi:hypothetical protein